MISQAPHRILSQQLLTLVLENIPTVSPFSMETDGPKAFRYLIFMMFKNNLMFRYNDKL